MIGQVAANDMPRTGAWFTATELAAMALPGLPGDKRAINRRAQEERWTLRIDGEGNALVRPRAGRGGGVEFHVDLLPADARLELARRGITAPAPIAECETPAAASWRWFEAQTDAVRDEAARRLAIVAEIETLQAAGMSRSAAVSATARSHARASRATIYNWLRDIEGVPATDRLPAIAPRPKAGGKVAEIDPRLWHLFKSDWMRLECPTLTSCYDRTAARAAELGLPMASEKAFRRRIDRELDPRQILLARGGREKLERSIPDNRRSVAASHALDMVNVDGHKFDVFVIDPATGKTVRPMMIAIQDVFSRKMLAWRLDLSENYLATRLAFADLFEQFGIPNTCYLDNSRTFAGKQLTGGTRTRFRNKYREEEAAGLLVSLGVKVRFTQVYHGQSKPIERAFRDIADRVARHPACAGAYTGNSPMAKPANYGSRAVEWDAFEAIVAAGIADHNARVGRRTEMARGRSFDQVFAESYAASTIRKAGPEQLRMALLAAEQKRLSRRTGEIELFGNRYWSEACQAMKGERVTVRFDPDNLHKDVHLYAAVDGRYLASAAPIGVHGFDEMAGALAARKRKKSAIAAVRTGLEAERLLTAEEVAAEQAAVRTPQPLTEAAAIRPVRARMTAGRTGSAALKMIEQADATRAQDEAARQVRVHAALRLVED